MTLRRILAGVPLGASLLAAFLVGQWMADAPNSDSPPPAPMGDHLDSGQAAGTAQSTPEAAEQVWTCSMHPHVRQNEPGACPLCGMDLVPVQAGGDQVALTDEAHVLARIETTRALRKDVRRTLSLVGEITEDESRVSRSSAWFGGRIETLHVSAVGDFVDQGAPLFAIYSPELLVAQRELLEASRQAKRVGALGEHSGPLVLAAHRAADAARERLQLWGLTSAQIRRIQRRGKASQTVTVYAPRAGTITTLAVRAGDTVREGAPILTLADLSQVWVELGAYERDLPFLSVGQTVTFEVASRPGKTFSAPITFISPAIDRTRRTATVRLALPAGDAQLRPGAFVRARVEAPWPGETPLVIPQSAPLLAGHRAVVFVAIEGANTPTYALREVTLGPRVGEFWIVLDGLMAGEAVVTEGAFKLDSALQIRGDASLMSPVQASDANAEAQDPAALLGAAVHALGQAPPSGEAVAALEGLIAQAKTLAGHLADDDLPASLAVLPDLRAALSSARSAGALPGGPALDAAMDALAAPLSDISSLRAAYLTLSKAVVPLAEWAKGQLKTPFQTTFCPMANEDRGAYWLQEPGAVDNPYFGAQMLSCGMAVEAPAP